MADKIYAVDTNVLIYLHDKLNSNKREIAENILAANPKISSQVVSEYLNTTKRLLNLSKTELLLQCAELFSGFEIVSVTKGTLLFASTLTTKYDIQLFDSIIVAAAIESNCNILYSEDMQHNLVINNTLTIINPLLTT